jgi:hypothetical protein
MECIYEERPAITQSIQIKNLNQYLYSQVKRKTHQKQKLPPPQTEGSFFCHQYIDEVYTEQDTDKAAANPEINHYVPNTRKEKGLRNPNSQDQKART